MPTTFARDTGVTTVALVIDRGSPAAQVVVDNITCGFVQAAASLPVAVSVDATVILPSGSAQTNFLLYAQKIGQTTASKKDGFVVSLPTGARIGDKGANTAAIQVVFDTAPTSIDFSVSYHYE